MNSPRKIPEWKADRMDLNLSNKVALVTGGASGIGAACARAFHNAGAKVVLADLNLDAASALAAELGEGAAATKLDVGDPDSCQAMVDFAVQTFGGLDIAVNDTGRVGGPQRGGDVEAEADELWFGECGEDLEPSAERARDQVHHHPGDAVGAADIAYGHDVRMPQSSRRCGFAAEARLDDFVARVLGAQHLHGHRDLELGITRLVHPRVRARAKEA